jgi:2-phosphosulfolactate phosphatase
VQIRFVDNDGCDGISDVAVVIDVIRAFSFAAYALSAGADRLVLVDDLDEALRVAAAIPGALAGKDGPPADGFDLFNSPGQLLERDDLSGRTIVHRTSAGTIGAVAARRAPHLFCASFVVAAATVSRISALAPSGVTFVITGGLDADEDLACAEYLAACLVDGRPPDPVPFLARVDVAGARLRRGLAAGHRGIHSDDVDLCMDLDRFDFALRATDEGDHLVLRRA